MTLPSSGPLGAALRSVPLLDSELIRYVETGQQDALDRALHAAQAAVRHLTKEIARPSVGKMGME